MLVSCCLQELVDVQPVSRFMDRNEVDYHREMLLLNSCYSSGESGTQDSLQLQHVVSIMSRSSRVHERCA